MSATILRKGLRRGRTPLLSLLLAAIVALTGFTAAQSRIGGPALTEAVICQGSALVVVRIDSQGRPAGPAQPCPDALGALFLADGVASGLPRAIFGRMRALRRPAIRACASRPVPAPRARAPPPPFRRHHPEPQGRRIPCTDTSSPFLRRIF
jgi:hypothetical protein